MGGGHFNGKNHGGEHTGDGKKQKKGPYFRFDLPTLNRDII